VNCRRRANNAAVAQAICSLAKPLAQELRDVVIGRDVAAPENGTGAVPHQLRRDLDGALQLDVCGYGEESLVQVAPLFVAGEILQRRLASARTSSVSE
jgi:hypothetical protein